MLLSGYLPLFAGLLFATRSFADNSTIASDVYAASDFSVSFALNIPNDSNDIYFSLGGMGDGSWIAVGFGSEMSNALMLVAYPSSNGTGVTISPRTSSGHVEPSFSSNVNITLLSGSGVSNNTLIANARCTGCRAWLTTNNPAPMKMIMAYGPYVGNGDSVAADLRYHSVNAVFTMDLQKATGKGGVPANTAQNVGSTEISFTQVHEFSGPFHACIMILTFVGVMPFGVLLLRVLGWKRWHGVNQTFGTILALIGMACGAYAGTLYNRTKKFSSGHQIFGLIITVSVVAQFVLGIMHHRIYKQTQAPTKLAPVHIWLGRFVILGGIANGFAGFPLALATHYNYVLLALVLLVAFPFTGIIFCAHRRKIRKEERANQPEDPKLFTSAPAAFGWTASAGNDFAMHNMGTPGAHTQPQVEPWSRV